MTSGERAVLRQPGGGGFGDPLTRPPAAKLADVREGFVTVAGAALDYGVVIDPVALTLDEVATTALRASYGRLDDA